jgi:hypothetical protein
MNIPTPQHAPTLRPRHRNQNQGRYDEPVSNSVLLDSINNLQDKFTTLLQTLPQLYMSRHDGDAMNTRLTALEEWRLGEMRRMSEQYTSLERQIGTAKTQASSAISDQRTQLDTRIINFFLGSISSGAVVFVIYILTHLH